MTGLVCDDVDSDQTAPLALCSGSELLTYLSLYIEFLCFTAFNFRKQYGPTLIMYPFILRASDIIQDNTFILPYFSSYKTGVFPSLE